MLATIIKLVSAIANGVGGYFKWKSSAYKQYTEAEEAVEKENEKALRERSAIENAVFQGDAATVNRIINGSFGFMVALFCGCVSVVEPLPIYVPADRAVSPMTNSVGMAGWFVPNPVMADFLMQKTEIKDLKNKIEVMQRVK